MVRLWRSTIMATRVLNGSSTVESNRESWCITCSTSSASATGISDPSPCHGERVYSRNFSGRTTPSADHITTEGLATYAGALALGLEGIVGKDAKSVYVEGPAVTWHW